MGRDAVCLCISQAVISRHDNGRQLAAGQSPRHWKFRAQDKDKRLEDADDLCPSVCSEKFSVCAGLPMSREVRILPVKVLSNFAGTRRQAVCPA